VSLFTFTAEERAAGIHWTGGSEAQGWPRMEWLRKTIPTRNGSPWRPKQSSYQRSYKTRIKEIGYSKLKHTCIESLFKTVFKILRSSTLKNTHYMECMYSIRKTCVRNAWENNNLFVSLFFCCCFWIIT
jgi:hypothetical protein